MALQIKVEMKGLDDFAKDLARAPALAKKELSRAVGISVQTIASNARKEAPVNKQTGGGNLRQSIIGAMRGLLTGVVLVRSPYGLWVHEGTDPHIILPKNKKALANTRTGQFFGRRVKHPGTAANPFLVRGIKNSLLQIEKAFTDAVEKVLKSLE